MTVMPRAPSVRTLLRVVLFLAGLGILIRLVIALELTEILRLMGRTGWRLLTILPIYGGCQLARAAALWLCQPQKDLVKYREVLAIRVSAEAVRLVTFAGPFLAESSKVWLLGRHGLETRDGIAAITAEIVSHSLVATIISIAALSFLIAGFDVSQPVRTIVIVLLWVMSVYLVVAVVATWFRIYLIGAGARLLAKLGLLRFVQNEDAIRKMEDLLLLVLRERPGRLGGIILFQVAANVFLMLEIFVALHAMGFAIPTYYPFLIEGGLKFISVAFFFIPTQVGVSEGMYALLLDSLGVTAAAGVSLALIRRLRTLVVGAIGLVLILATTRGQQH